LFVFESAPGTNQY